MARCLAARVPFGQKGTFITWDDRKARPEVLLCCTTTREIANMIHLPRSIMFIRMSRHIRTTSVRRNVKVRRTQQGLMPLKYLDVSEK